MKAPPDTSWIKGCTIDERWGIWAETESLGVFGMSDLPAVPATNAPSEPLVSVGTVTTIVTAVIALLVAFGLHLSNAQSAGILGVVAVAAPLVVTLVGRMKVFSPATVRAMVLNARGVK